MSKPLPKGALVTGRIKESNLCAAESCRDHVWILISKPRRVDFGTGWVQRARCVVDGQETAYISTEFWEERADLKKLRTVIQFINEEIEDLKEARRFIKKRLAKSSQT